MKLAKPHKEFFLKMLKESNSTANESVFVDDAKRNLIPAKEVGMVTIWVNNHNEDKRNNFDFKPDFEIEDLREIKEILIQLNKKK